MRAEAVIARPRPWLGHFRIGRARGLLVAVAVFIILLIVNDAISATPMSYFEVSYMSSGGATLALAAVGQTIVILSGGFDLSAGAVISLVNVVLSTYVQDTTPSILTWALLGIGVGVVTGAFNGFFIAIVRLQPIVVTLSTMFIVQGLTLLVMDKPGGAIPGGLSSALVGDAIPNLLPMPIVIVAITVLLWLWLKNTPFGRALYAIGSDMDAARARGVRVRAGPRGHAHRPPARAGRLAGRRVHDVVHPPAIPRPGPHSCSSSSTSSPVAATAPPACSFRRSRVPATLSSATRSCSRCSPPWWSGAPPLAAAAAVRSARSSAPTS